MAIFESAAFVTLKKSFGNLTTYRSRGINILRMKTKEVRNPRTPEQQIRRVRLGELARLSRGVRAAHRLGFPQRPLIETTYNTFVRLNTQAVAVNDDLQAVTDFSALVCSQGSRKVPQVAVSISREERQVTMSGAAGGFGPDSDASDRVYVALYESGQNVCGVYELGKRSELETQTATLPEGWEAEQVHAYAFVCSAGKDIASDSKYITVGLE